MLFIKYFNTNAVPYLDGQRYIVPIKQLLTETLAPDKTTGRALRVSGIVMTQITRYILQQIKIAVTANGTLMNGVSNTLNSSGYYNNIFNGTGNSITGTTSGATMISCSGRTATTSNATFVENLVIFNYTNLNYADDTAAAAGGVVLGQVYHNSGALRIRVV